MKLVSVLLALIAAFCNAAANVTLREAGLGRSLIGSFSLPGGEKLSDWYLFSLVLYGGSFFAYAFAIRSLSPPIAYPIVVGCAYLLTVIATATITREVVPWQTILGGVCIVVGLIAIVTSPGSKPA